MTARTAKKVPAGAFPPDGTMLSHATEEHEVIGGRLIPIVDPAAAEKRLIARARRERTLGKSEPLDKVRHDLGRRR